jgi:hypothetical protein
MHEQMRCKLKCSANKFLIKEAQIDIERLLVLVDELLSSVRSGLALRCRP